MTVGFVLVLVLVIMLSTGWSVFVVLAYQFDNNELTTIVILVNIALIVAMATYIINSTGWLNQVL